MLSYLFELLLVLTTSLDGWLGGWLGGCVALEEWKLRLTSTKAEVKVEAELQFWWTPCIISLKTLSNFQI